MCSYGCLDDLRNGVEVRDARRSAMAALIAAIVTDVAMLGWITWVAFVVGAIGGIFGIVANSLMLCCGDLNQRPGLCCDAGGQLAAHKLPCRLAASKVLNMIAFHAVTLVAMGRYTPKLHKAYTLFYLIGTYGAIQVPVVGLTPLKSMEQLGALGVFGIIQVSEKVVDF